MLPAMARDPRFHHCCVNVATGSLETAIELFELLEFRVVYAPPGGARWIMLGQQEPRCGLRSAEVEAEPIADAGEKVPTHVALLSDDPRAVLDRVEQWALSKGLAFRRGGWSQRELWFDLQSVFLTFVVEVMHTSVEEE